MSIVNKTLSSFSDYYNRIQAGNRWLDVRFRSGRALQAPELNELQTILLDRIKTLGDSVYKDGAIIGGAVPKIIAGSGVPNITLFAGTIYFAGAINVLPETTLQIPLTGQVFVGIRYREREVTETDDTSLLDPSVDGGNYLEGGAGRSVSEYHWGWQVDDATHDITEDYSADENWTFFPIYEIQDGVIIIKELPKINDATLDLIARYDRESNGNYVVTGLEGEFVEETETTLRFNVRGGTANVLGYKIDRIAAERVLMTKNPDTTTVTAEPHLFTPDAQNGNKCLIFFNRSPMAEISRLTVVKQRTVSITHGVSGSSDELPDASVLSVLSVTKAGTTYTSPTSYVVSGDNIDWSPGGAEPAAGDTYTVTYTYQVSVVVYGETKDASIRELTKDYIVLYGLVSGSQVEFDYTYKLPRIDLLVLNRDGTIERIMGVAQRRNPSPPIPATHQIALCQIQLDWLNPPVVSNSSVKAVRMFELAIMQADIANIYDLVALERLKTGIAISDPDAKHGLYVDSFRNDNLRDSGLTQTAACVDGTLMLGVSGSPATPNDAVERKKYHMLPFTYESALEQQARTETMKINPYQAFQPLPGVVTLTPAFDRWVETQSIWTSPATQAFYRWFPHLSSAGVHGLVTTSQVDLRVVGVTWTKLAYIRVRSVGFVVDGFGPGETLSALTFDGVTVTP